MNKFRNWLVMKLRSWAYLLRQLAWRLEAWDIVPNAHKRTIKLARKILSGKEYWSWKQYTLVYPNIHPSHFEGVERR